MSDDFDDVGRMLNRIWLRHFLGFAERLYVDGDDPHGFDPDNLAEVRAGDGSWIPAQRIEARSDETPQEARPVGREPDGEADAP